MATYEKQKKNRLRVAKALLDEHTRTGEMTGNDLPPEDRKIGSRLLLSLARKRKNQKRNIGDVQHLKDWFNNKEGIRDRVAWAKKSKKIAKAHRSGGFGDRPKIKSDYLEEASGRVEKKLRSLSPSVQLQDQPPKESASTKKVAKVVPRIVDTGIAFGPRTEKKKISASPIGTVYHGAKSKASVSPRGGVSKAPEVSSRTQTSKEKQLSPFGTAFSNARKAGKDVFTFKGKKYTTELASSPRKRESPPPAPKRKPKQGRTAREETARISRTGGETPFSQSKQKKKKTTETQKPGLMPWDWKRTDTTGPTDLGLGKREYETLFGKMTIGEDPEETARKAREFEETNYKKGGQVKKGVKKTKAKARRRAALRGHRAELRGG